MLQALQTLHFNDPKILLFLQIIVVIGVPLLFWSMGLRKFLPLAIVQIFAGIFLGPSIFGALAPEVFNFLFAPQVRSNITTLSNVAIILFVFLAGCEADRGIIRQSAGVVLRIGTIGVATPWIVGALVGIAILSFFSGTETAGLIIGRLNNEPVYALSYGLAMAVTALPVLVIVLRELGFIEKPIGSIALAIGGFDDGALWLSLACLLPFAAGSGNVLAAFLTAICGGVIAFVVVAKVITPIMKRLLDNHAPEAFVISLSIIVLFFAAGFTELTGLHAAVGSFATGLLLPDALRHKLVDKLDVPVSLLLMPFFFLATGLTTKFAFNDPVIWVMVVVTLATCMIGKFLGVTIPALLMGKSVGFSVTLGVLMQCKGLMEIVVVTVLYQKGIFGDTTFSALVLVALISTVLTVPLVRLTQRLVGEAATAGDESGLPKTEVDVGGHTIPQGAMASGPQLELLETGEAIPLGKPELVIGRHSEDDIRIKDVRVSRHHAKLVELADGKWQLVNQTAGRSEPNLITVNGNEREQTMLADGDTISLGGVLMRFRSGAKAPMPAH